jgi:hypothetical protein
MNDDQMSDICNKLRGMGHSYSALVDALKEMDHLADSVDVRRIMSWILMKMRGLKSTGSG